MQANTYSFPLFDRMKLIKGKDITKFLKNNIFPPFLHHFLGKRGFHCTRSPINSFLDSIKFIN